jgi:hypothetical protein
VNVKLVAKTEAGAPIPGALFTFKDGTGKPIAALTGGQDGSITVSTYEDDTLFAPDTNVIVSSTGFEDSGIITSAIATYNEWDFTLAKTNLLPILGIGALFAIAAHQAVMGAKGKKKVGKVTIEEIKPWIIPGAAVIGGLLLYSKIFGASAEQQQYLSTIDASVNAAGATGLSAAEIATTADTIENDLNKSSISNNTDDAVSQMSKVTNLADIYSLIKAYGSRWQFFFGIPRGKATLQQVLNEELSTSNLHDINADLSSKGINFQF